MVSSVKALNIGHRRGNEQLDNAQLDNYVTLLSNNVNRAQHVNIKAIYKNHAAVYDVIEYKNTTQQHELKKYGELANN